MFSPITRRDFVTQATTLSAAAAVGDFAFLDNLPPVSAQEARPSREMVRFGGDIEPLVRFIEDTARDRLLEGVAQRIRAGTSYQELLAALMLAGVRGIHFRQDPKRIRLATLAIRQAHSRQRGLSVEPRRAPRRGARGRGRQPCPRRRNRDSPRKRQLLAGKLRHETKLQQRTIRRSA